jgi:hypothetical protein
MSEYINAESQIRLAAVLRYRERGDFAAFCRAADLALGADVSNEQFYCANLLLGYQIAGLCEVSVATGSTRWWASHTGDIRIGSAVPKEIGVSPAWFEANSHVATPVIADAKGAGVVLGSVSRTEDESDPNSVFNRPLTDLLPSFSRLDQQLCVEVPFNEDLPGHVECFNAALGQWQLAHADSLQGSNLIRIRKEYAGTAYYVQYTALRLRFNLPQPEWAFVAAFHLLPWRLSNLIELAGQRVVLRRAVRLPILMYRLLFAAARRVEIGPTITFFDVTATCIDGFRAYFSAAGDRI